MADKGKGDSDIDVLIGADYYWDIVEGEIKRENNERLIALKSKLGWLLSGPLTTTRPVAVSVNLALTHVLKVDISLQNETLGDKINEFWSLDSIGICDKESSIYEECIDKIEFVNNRYEVNLPFKNENPILEDNYNLCLKRLKNLKKKLDSNKRLLVEYDNIIKNQFHEGIIEKVTSPPLVGNTTYLPHRPVIREDKASTKVRIVYDASAKNKGPSLNESLYKGPCLTPLLFDVLLRFRAHDIALTADIEKAYLQISVTEGERDYLHFLWFDNIYKENPDIIKYRFCRVIFGATCSQFLLNATIKKHMSKFIDIDREFVEKVLRHFYVDDLNCGVNSVEDGVNFYEKLKSILLEANFNLRKWHTNSVELCKMIYEKEKQTKGIPICKENFIERESILKNDCTVTENSDFVAKENNFDGEMKGEKILGIRWEEHKDVLIIDLKELLDGALCYVPTKRNILRVIAGVYDPIGFIQPLVVKFKILFQEICLANVGWDDNIPENLEKKWFNIIDDVKQNERVIIQRCYYLHDVSDPIAKNEIHGFSDASEVAYGCCVYIKYITQSGNIGVSLITSKSRIVPKKKKFTIPRLELLGNYILSRLTVSVLSAFSNEIIIDNVYCWSDSQISLAWIKAVDKEFRVFVQNRVVDIRRNVNPNSWFYCRTYDNPADIITRFKTESLESLHMWWNGPCFLKSSNQIKI